MKKAKTYISLIQVNNSFSGQNYLPYSIACLESYVKENTSDFEFLEPIYKRMPIYKIVNHAQKADIIGISTYVWNAQISLEIARRIKNNFPEKLIIFGGPQVPDKPENFLRENKFIDLVVHNEGEKTFFNILKRYPSNNFDDLTGVSFIKNNQFFASMPTPRMRNLQELPSPFLNGMFDKLIADNPEEKWIGLWETNRGCPFQCTFCDWGSATASKVTKFEEPRLLEEVDWFANREIEYIFVCDANFGIQKRDVQISEYVAKIRKKTGFPHGFSVQNTKNATERAYLTQKILADAGLNKGVALSMQSLDEQTLINIKRDNISLDTYLELATRFTKDKVETYSDLILGLPGETYESFCKGVDTLVESGQHNRIQFNNLSILPNAEMGDSEYLKKFKMKTVRSEIINIHGSKEVIEDDVQEYQDLVIETISMPADMWRRTRVFSWMSAFLHFDKLFQIPIIYLLKHTKLKFSEIIEAFLNANSDEFLILKEVNSFLEKEALSIQNGGPEYVFSDEWLKIYWPADEYIFIKLTVENKLENFYKESELVLFNLLDDKGIRVSKSALSDTLKLNQSLISQPFNKKPLKLSIDYDIITFWNEVLKGKKSKLRKSRTEIMINRQNKNIKNLNDWCQRVVWWGNKKGEYLYKNKVVNSDRQLSGHY